MVATCVHMHIHRRTVYSDIRGHAQSNAPDAADSVDAGASIATSFRRKRCGEEGNSPNRRHHHALSDSKGGTSPEKSFNLRKKLRGGRGLLFALARYGHALEVERTPPAVIRRVSLACPQLDHWTQTF